MEPQVAAEEAQRHLIPDDDQLPDGLPEDVRKEAALRRALQKRCMEYAAALERGEMQEKSMDDFMAELDEIARAHGVESGLPMPSMHDVHRPIVLSRGAPLSRIPLNFNEQAQQLSGRRLRVRNSWHMLGDKSICVVDTEEGPMAWPEYDAGRRMRKLMDGMLMRSGSQQTAEAELRAMESLKKRVGKGQWESYVLNGAFPELSKKSNVHYIFRKGYPTIALTASPNKHGEGDGGLRVLACLCLHPMGYYAYTHCGLMVPTDEVICALLMMRGDEHAYWKSCGQWAVTDTRSGL